MQGIHILEPTWVSALHLLSKKLTQTIGQLKGSEPEEVTWNQIILEIAWYAHEVEPNYECVTQIT